MPKLIVLDEAHKYVRQAFAAEMETGVNQMRHTATTVIIASQSPNVIPSSVLEKSSVVMLHQLTSGAQVRYVKKVVQGLASVDLKKLSQLQKGRGILWASESTDRRVMESGLEVSVRPRFTRHV